MAAQFEASHMVLDRVQAQPDACQCTGFTCHLLARWVKHVFRTRCCFNWIGAPCLSSQSTTASRRYQMHWRRRRHGRGRAGRRGRVRDAHGKRRRPCDRDGRRRRRRWRRRFVLLPGNRRRGVAGFELRAPSARRASLGSRRGLGLLLFPLLFFFPLPTPAILFLLPGQPGGLPVRITGKRRRAALRINLTHGPCG